MLFNGLSSVKEEGGDGHADNQHESGYPGEESQHQQEGAKDLRKDDQDQAPAMTNMKRIEKYGLLVAEMHHFGKPVIDTDQQAEGEAQEQGGEVKACFGVGSGQKFLHANWNLDSKIWFWPVWPNFPTGERALLKKLTLRHW